MTVLIAPSMVRRAVVVVAQAWARPRTSRYTSSTVTSLAYLFGYCGACEHIADCRA